MSRGLARKRAPEPAQRVPVLPGCWVLTSDPELAEPAELALVVDGPFYEHAAGHALGEIWGLSDGSRRHHTELVVVDLGEVRRAAADALTALAVLRTVDEAEILLVHRAACLARRVLARGDRAAAPWLDELRALVSADEEISALEIAGRDAICCRLPNLAAGLYWAGALALAGSPGWVPGEPSNPHPRAPEIPARRTR